MPYISQECMGDFIAGLKDSAHLNMPTIKGAMKYYFGYKDTKSCPPGFKKIRGRCIK